MKKQIIVLLISSLFMGCGHNFVITDVAVPAGPSIQGDEDPIYQFIEKLSDEYVGQGIVAETGENKFPSMVVGVVTPRGQKILTFGLTTKGVRPTATDIYPISSISKMLTGLILARGVTEGSLQQTTKLSALLSSDLAPLVGDKTVGQAVAHFASFKVMPLNLDYTNAKAPAANYSRESLATCLASSDCSTIAQAPGSLYLYSDLGIGVLGLALVDFYKRGTYEELLIAKLLRDLKMTSTTSELSKYTDQFNIVQGTMTTGEVVPPATMGSLTAAGSVLSNGEDMLKLLNTMVKPQGQWQSVVDLATTPLRPGIGYAIDMGTYENMELHSKSGSQAGFSSLIMWNKKTASGIFVLGNQGKSSKSLARFLIRIHKQINDSP